jgi:hypothetical protein
MEIKEIEQIAKIHYGLPADLVIDAEERYYRNLLEYDGFIAGFKVGYGKKCIEFSEWLNDNQWRKRVNTHPNKVGQYYSDLHCEYKKIEDLYNEFINPPLPEKLKDAIDDDDSLEYTGNDLM